MEIVDDEILKIEGKHVIIIDDVLSTGTSFKDMIRAVGEFSPASVNGLTIFKRG
jgi:adenine/guanine phosphoribosyltransferase-like PRPP-binding protein